MIFHFIECQEEDAWHHLWSLLVLTVDIILVRGGLHRRPEADGDHGSETQDHQCHWWEASTELHHPAVQAQAVQWRDYKVGRTHGSRKDGKMLMEWSEEVDWLHDRAEDRVINYIQCHIQHSTSMITRHSAAQHHFLSLSEIIELFLNPSEPIHNLQFSLMALHFTQSWTKVPILIWSWMWPLSTLLMNKIFFTAYEPNIFTATS